MLTTANKSELKALTHFNRFTSKTFAAESEHEYSRLIEKKLNDILEEPIQRLKNAGKLKDLPIEDIAYAIKEAIINAVDYGVLGLSSKIKDKEDGARLLSDARIEAFKQTNSCVISFTLELNNEFLKVVISHDGKGFDPSKEIKDIADIDPLKTHGRGFAYNIKTLAFPDPETGYSPDGRTLTMVRRLT